MNATGILLSAALLAAAGCGKGGSAFAVVGVEELRAELESRRGEPLLVNFWATWCGPCVEELPDLAAVAEEFRGQGVRVLAVSYDLMAPGPGREESLRAVRDFWGRSKMPFDTVIFEGEDYDAINAALRLPGPVPVTLAFDAAGREVGRVEEGTGRDGFRELARRALAGG